MKLDIAEFKWILVATVVALVALGGTAMASTARLEYGNGVAATVYSADYLASRLTTSQGSPAIALPDGRLIPVVTDINDASIYNKGDGRFHPFTTELVDRALNSVSHPRLPLDARIYLLPYPRRGVLTSSTSGNEIFLSPHVLDIDADVAAYIIAHELGHVFHNRYLPSGSSLWQEYRAVRGITDESTFNDNGPHAYRPREIFAEDFRVLFGGEDAYFGGRIENTSIREPESVAGLKSFYLAAANVRPDARLDATCAPNPFNPSTQIRITVPVDGSEGSTRVSVRIYSVTGALVRDLYDGNASGDLAVQWDGADNRGATVASATYYAQISMKGERQTLKLVLLK